MMTGISRRQLGGLAAGALLATPAIRPAWGQERSITFAGYVGIFQENYTAAVIEPFMRANPGIRVNYYAMPNSAQTLGMLRAQRAAPQIDVAIYDVTIAKVATDEGLVEPISAAEMPVVNELAPAAVVQGVAGYGVTFDSLALLYAPEAGRPAPTSWNALFDPRHRGKIAFAGAPDIVGIGLTLVLNRMAGGTDYRQFDRGIARLSELAPHVLSFDPRPDAFTFVINGQASIGVGWNARAQLYARQSNGRMGASLPEEGSLFQINMMSVVKNAPQTEAAKRFMAYALSTEAQKSFTERMFYAPVNTRAQIAPEALASTAAASERMSKMLDVDWLEVAKVRERINEQWRRRILTRT